MDWVCADCGRVHDEPPARCVCGGADIAPAGGSSSALERAYRRLTDPEARAGLLVADSPLVSLLFYLLLALAALLVAVVVLSML